MRDVTVAFFNMSVAASWAALIVMLIRLVFRHMPGRSRCLLWAMVAIRLVIPSFIGCMFSGIPGAHMVRELQGSYDLFADSGVPVIDALFEEAIIAKRECFPKINTFTIGFYLWLFGVIIMIFYASIKSMEIKRRIKICDTLKEGIVTGNAFETPFVFGLFHPVIFIPDNLSKEENNTVISHEKMHIRRGDHIWKAMSWLLLSAHWFNPIMWIAFQLYSLDTEIACDEMVLKDASSAEMKQYIETMANTSKRTNVAIQRFNAFGAIRIKNRIERILETGIKKQSKKAVAMILILTAVLVLTDPISAPKVTNPYDRNKTAMDIEIDDSQTYIENLNIQFMSYSRYFVVGWGENGKPVFREPERAWKVFRELYSAPIREVMVKYSLPPLNYKTIGLYKIYGWQADGDKTKVVSEFLDIYENSYD